MGSDGWGSLSRVASADDERSGMQKYPKLTWGIMPLGPAWASLGFNHSRAVGRGRSCKKAQSVSTKSWIFTTSSPGHVRFPVRGRRPSEDPGLPKVWGTGDKRGVASHPRAQDEYRCPNHSVWEKTTFLGSVEVPSSRASGTGHRDCENSISIVRPRTCRGP